MKSKKVLILVRRLDRGGAEMLESRLAVELNNLGLETYICAQYSPDKFSGNTKALYWKKEGVPEVFFLNSDVTIFGVFVAFARLIKIIKKNRIRYVISSNSGLDTIGIVAKLITRHKHIVAFHDYIKKDNLNKLRIKIWRYLLRYCDFSYAITDYVRTNVARTVERLDEKIVTIYNSLGQPTSNSSYLTDIREEFGLGEESKVLLYVGRLNYRKGVDITIEYIGDLMREMGYYLLIVGDKISTQNIEYGSLDYQKILIDNIKEKRIEHRVIFTGFRADVFQIMEQADLLVHLARHEGFGLILLEAAKAGLPILASNVGGIPEVLKNMPYEPMNIDSPNVIRMKVTEMLNMNANEKAEKVLRAKESLRYFTDTRRSKDVKKILDSFDN